MQRGEMSSSNKPERKHLEKNRRDLMKDLCSKMVSLIPPHHSMKPKKFLSQPNQLGLAASYIKNLRERVEGLRKKRDEMMQIHAMKDGGGNTNNENESKLPIVEINDLVGYLEVILISGSDQKIMVHQVIRMIEEEGADVVSVSIATIDDKVFYTLQAQVKISRVGVDISRIRERMHELIFPKSA